jgi:hypothetical protein
MGLLIIGSSVMGRACYILLLSDVLCSILIIDYVL